jgi:hypothetical protein
MLSEEARPGVGKGPKIEIFALRAATLATLLVTYSFITDLSESHGLRLVATRCDSVPESAETAEVAAFPVSLSPFSWSETAPTSALPHDAPSVFDIFSRNFCGRRLFDEPAMLFENRHSFFGGGGIADRIWTAVVDDLQPD